MQQRKNSKKTLSLCSKRAVALLEDSAAFLNGGAYPGTNPFLNGKNSLNCDSSLINNHLLGHENGLGQNRFMRSENLLSAKNDPKSENSLNSKKVLQYKKNGGHKKPSRPITFMKKELYAAIDLGSNNCRLLIAAPSAKGEFRVVDAFSRVTRLGEGVSFSHKLSDKAINRAVEALRLCQKKLDKRNIVHKRFVATQACRIAENSAYFIEKVYQETGLELEILSQAEEAKLAVTGCAALVKAQTKAFILFDIGGGSTEISLVDLSQKRAALLGDNIISWFSLPLGILGLAEKFPQIGRGGENFYTMKAYVSGFLKNFKERDSLGALAQDKNFYLLGTSGTVTTLAGLYLDLKRYDRRQIDGFWLKDEDIDNVIKRLLSWDMDQKIANPCIGGDRANFIIAGCAILEAIRQMWPCRQLLVADRGVREGILTELMVKNGVWS